MHLELDGILQRGEEHEPGPIWVIKSSPCVPGPAPPSTCSTITPAPPESPLKTGSYIGIFQLKLSTFDTV
jgi:hypothetical protein